jgi:hypothetical protein
MSEQISYINYTFEQSKENAVAINKLQSLSKVFAATYEASFKETKLIGIQLQLITEINFVMRIFEASIRRMRESLLSFRNALEVTSMHR